MKQYNMSQYINVTESGLVKTGFGKLKGVIVNSHTSGTLRVFDAVESNSVAVGTLTSTGACVPASHGQTELTSSGAMVAGSHAVSVLTGNAIVNGNVMVIGTRTYTFKTTLSGNPQVADEILIGADLEATLLNAKYAINATSGYRGVNYSVGTTVNTQVVAVASDTTTLTVRGRVPGTSLNTIATTGTALRTVWADTTLGGGTGASDPGVTTGAATVTIGAVVYTVVDALSETYGADAIAYQVLKGASEATMLDNLKSAINASSGEGATYSTGTVAHPYVRATDNSNTVQKIVSRTVGTAAQVAVINTLATTETMANTAWADTTFGGGAGNSNPVVTSDAALITIGDITYTAVIELSETSGADAVANQILWVTSEAMFLDNLKATINASGTAGTTYSTGTVRHPQVKATTNANDSQIIEAFVRGVVGNAIVTTDTLANYAWGAGTLASGAGVSGKVMFETLTFSAVATTGERFIDFGNVSFENGLYVIVGGTANLTLIID